MLEDAKPAAMWTLKVANLTPGSTPQKLRISRESRISDIKKELGSTDGRIIYRGKVLSCERLCDVVGLSDGQTIHYVPRQVSPPPSPQRSRASSVETPETIRSPAASPGASLLSPLLGLGPRLGRAAGGSGNAVVEPTRNSVGQSLATLNTLRTKEYVVGQWLDCLDTVSQWLESTVLQTLKISDVPSSSPSYDSGLGTIMRPLPGSSSVEEVRRMFRSEDDACQIVRIRYNGWPSRWDEWVRVDSGRLSPFRTKTRHYHHGCPTPNVVVECGESEVNVEELSMDDVWRGVENVKEMEGGRKKAAIERLGRILVDAARVLEDDILEEDEEKQSDVEEGSSDEKIAGGGDEGAGEKEEKPIPGPAQAQAARRHTLAAGMGLGGGGGNGSGINDDNSKEGVKKKTRNLNLLGKLFRKTLGRKQGRRKSTL
ncbi:hypothetical protein TL16_g05995 [Triparma laevis f. inornata]|uniref:Ubiquitin-like domain-containing protein n=1 Tax=Triparma laevis f. inornata TaxID=1714386 RepID=A0A9W7ALG5_9STRA|nr:hypothetical protein TL16_g05995 [Triparma laevis f. inornata]